MTDRQYCAGGVVFDADRRLLLIRRGRAPSAGTWSIPGGRCEPAESAEDACVREVAEETGLAVTIVRWAGRVERAAPGGGIYVIDDFVCRLADPPLVGRSSSGPSPVAGDDACDARWVTRNDLAGLDLAPGVRESLAAWDLLPD